jgi:hypothetical protein
MAYKQKGCTPITAKIQKTTKGGMTNPLLKAMGVPMKKNPSMAKQVEGPKPAPAGDISMTPYSKEKALYTKSGSRGKINGPKVSYDMAYEKAKKTKRYANMSKADYIKEAKRQTKSFKESGNWDATPKKPKVKAISTVKSESVKSESVKSSKPKVEKTAEIKVTPKVAKTKKEARVENRTNRQTARKENRANRKATREENRANRKAARKGSPAKQTMQQQNRIDRKERREAVRARRVTPKKGNAKMAKKAKVYGE